MHNVTEVQTELQRLGFGPGAIDGRFGKNTLDALNRYLASHGKPPITGLPTLIEVNDAIWPPPPAPPKPPNIIDILRGAAAVNKGDFSMIPASLQDYVINFLSSKINWFAGVMAVAIFGFINGHFGFQIDAGTTGAITTLLVTIMTGGIWVLRTFFNKPSVVSGMVVKS